MLLTGAVLLRMPGERLPSRLLHALLVYELAWSMALYGYNVYCSAYDLSASSVGGWPERFGFQNLLQDHWQLGEEAHRACAILVQVLAAYALAAVSRARAQAEVVPPMFSAITRGVVAFMRIPAIACVLWFAFSPNGCSLIGLGYIFVTISLVTRGSTMPTRVGWDLLRASETGWGALFWYSYANLVASFSWEIFAETDLDLVGLARPQDPALQNVWLQLLIALLASMQARALGSGMLQPTALITTTSALAWASWLLGICVQLAVMVAILLSMSHWAMSFCVLFLFAALVLVAFEPGRACAACRNRLLLAAGIFAGVTLPLRHAIHIPAVQQWLLANFALKAAAKATDARNIELELWLLAALFVVSLGNRRVLHCGLYTSLPGARLEVLRKHHMYGTSKVLLKFVTRWSTSLLVVSAYFLLWREDASVSASVQTCMLLMLMLFGRKWRYVGILLSVCSFCQMLLQYVAQSQDVLDLLTPAVRDTVDYLGLSWNATAFNLELLLLLLCLAQRSLVRVAELVLGGEVRAAGTESIFLRGVTLTNRLLRGELAAYSAQIGACVLFLLASMQNSAWSILFLNMVLFFRICRDGARRLEYTRALLHLRIMTLLLAVHLAFRLAAVTRLPPGVGTLGLPSAHGIAEDRLCLTFSADPASNGVPSERSRCASDWIAWLGLAATRDGSDTLCFLALYALCELRRFVLGEQEEQLRKAQEEEEEEEV
jgi:hypothetical protein